jgi:hypothetical protein
MSLIVFSAGRGRSNVFRYGLRINPRIPLMLTGSAVRSSGIVVTESQPLTVASALSHFSKADKVIGSAKHEFILPSTVLRTPMVEPEDDLHLRSNFPKNQDVADEAQSPRSEVKNPTWTLPSNRFVSVGLCPACCDVSPLVYDLDTYVE